MQLGFVSAILPDLSLDEVVAFRGGRGVRVRGADVLAAGQGRAALCGRDARRRRPTSTATEARADRRSDGSRPGVAISGLGYYPNPLTPDAAEAERLHRAPQAGDRGGRAAGRAAWSTRSSAAIRPGAVDDNWPRFLEVWRPLVAVCRGPRRADRHRELPDALHGRRMARRQEPGPLPGDLAADVRRHPQRQLRAELRSLALGLAADRLRAAAWRSSPGGSSTCTPRTRWIERERLERGGHPGHAAGVSHAETAGPGRVDWGRFLSALARLGYDGPVCVEVEDREYEDSLDLRKRPCAKRGLLRGACERIEIRGNGSASVPCVASGR